MKKILAFVAMISMLVVSPTVAMAKGYSGGGSYRSSSSFGSYSSASHAYSSSGSSLTSPSSSGSYHSGASNYSGSSSTRSGSNLGTYHSGYKSPTYGSRSQGGLFGNGSRGFGWSHLASFGGGFLLGSMFHPFGWGFGGGYGGLGYGGPGYSPMWSIFGLIVDLLIAGLVIWIVYRLFRARSRRNRVVVEPEYGGRFGSQFGTRSRSSHQLDEQAVVDACCELVASRHGCDPQEVMVDLTFERDTNQFGADILISGRRAYPLHQQDLVDAVAKFVASRERVRDRNVAVDLQFDEAFGVHAGVRIA